MSLLKKPIKPIEFELFVQIVCPHCLKDTDQHKGKRIAIQIPARGLPKSIRCFNCDQVIHIVGLFSIGKETVRRAYSETIKGVDNAD